MAVIQRGYKVRVVGFCVTLVIRDDSSKTKTIPVTQGSVRLLGSGVTFYV